jgi:hypothetical protein
VFRCHTEIGESIILPLLRLEGATEGKIGMASKSGERPWLGSFSNLSQGVGCIRDRLVRAAKLSLDIRPVRPEDGNKISPLLAGPPRRLSNS